MTSLYINSTLTAQAQIPYNIVPGNIAVGGQRVDIVKDLTLSKQINNTDRAAHGELEYIIFFNDSIDDRMRNTLENLNPDISSSIPSFVSFTPNVVKVSTPTLVRVKGMNFGTLASVEIDGVRVTGLQILSDTDATFYVMNNASSNGTSKVSFIFGSPSGPKKVIVENGLSVMRNPSSPTSTSASTLTTSTMSNQVDIRTLFNQNCGTNQILNIGQSDDKVTFLGNYESYVDCVNQASIPAGTSAITYFDTTQTDGTAKQCYAVKNYSASARQGATCGLYGPTDLSTVLPKKAYPNFRESKPQFTCGNISTPKVDGNGYAYIGTFANYDACYTEYVNNPKYRDYNLGFEPKSLVFYQCPRAAKCESNGISGDYSLTCYISSNADASAQTGATCVRLTTTYDPIVSTFADVNMWMSSFGMPKKKANNKFF